MSDAKHERKPTGGPATGRITGLELVRSDGFEGYRLIDSGGGRKLERFGKIIVDRPEPQALWRPRFGPERWAGAHAVFSATDDEEAGRWRVDKPVPESWPVRLRDVSMICRLSSFRHLGLFPEQLPHWDWMLAQIAAARKAGVERPRVLNLFAYTGAATLLAAKAGAEVTHVDASKKAITWAKENQQASNLTDAPIRWMLDDARKFVAREVRRERTYHVILVDPPKFGRGPGGEVWELFEHVTPLIIDCAKLLDRQSAAMVLTAYAIRASAISIGQLVADTLDGRPGTIDCGELAIAEENGGRLVPTSLFSRWCADDRRS